MEKKTCTIRIRLFLCSRIGHSSQKTKQTKTVGVSVKHPYKDQGGAEKMAKNKKSKFSKNRKGVSEANVEFAGENGLEKLAIKAQQNHNQ
jgi:hypothetical protein